MAMFLGIIGILGAPCCLIWLIVNAVRWDSKKPPLIGLLMCAVLFFVGVGMYELENKTPSSDDVGNLVNSSSERSGLSVEDEITEADDNNESESSLKTGDYQLPCGVKLHFYDSVRNDVTGRWRSSGTTSSLPPMDFAVEYYEMMFSSDDEVHSIWNATLKTTTKITVSENLLFVDTFEYVAGEEQDAQKLFSGTLLDSRIIDLKTGQLFEDSMSETAPELKVIAPATTSTAKSDTEKSATNKNSGTWGEDSTTNEITGSTSRTAYWTSGGKSYHFSSDCPSLSRSKNIKSGTLQDALNTGKTDPCNNCANGS